MAQAPIPNNRPSFDDLVRAYPSPLAYSAGAVKRLIGGAIDDTGAPPADQWLGGEEGDTCTIRMSRAFNATTVKIPAHYPGFRTVRGADGLHYGFAVQEFHAWIAARLGKPDVVERGKPVKRNSFLGKRGIIVLDIVFGLNRDGRTRALGHADLWDGRTFFDEAALISTPDRDFFTMADAVSLWICPGTAMLPRS